MPNRNPSGWIPWLLLAIVLVGGWLAWPRQQASLPATGAGTPYPLPPAEVRSPSPLPMPPVGASRPPVAAGSVPALPDFLPPEAHDTIALIRRDGPFPHRQDGGTFGNREGHLPRKPRGWYREYTVDRKSVV